MTLPASTETYNFGEHLLQQACEDIRNSQSRWHEFFALAERRNDLQTLADLALAEMIQSREIGSLGELDQVLEDSSSLKHDFPELGELVLAAAIADEACSNYQVGSHGMYYEVQGRIGHVHILGQGVKQTRRLKSFTSKKAAYHGFDSSRRPVEVGRQYEGKIITLHSTPSYAGRLVLEGRFAYTELRGIIDPVTLDPRISLETEE